MLRHRTALAVLALLAACQDGTVTAPPSNDVRGIPSRIAAIDDGPVTYFAPRTITREGTGLQTVQFPLQDREHSLFMEPFVLHVRADGDQRIVGIVRVDGVAILERRDLVALGRSAEPLALEVPIGPTSVVTVELQGPTGGTLTFWIDAPLQPPPVITITSPVRHAAGDFDIGQPGAFLQQGTLLPSPVEITGTACHVRYPITELEVAGVAVPVSGSNLCEPFTVTQQSRWGLSIINGVARNSRGRVGTVVQSYARSPEYYDLAKDAADSRRIEGLFTRLGQSAIDDGDRSTVNDLATLLERQLAGPISIPPGTVIACTLRLFQVDATGGVVYESVRVNSLTVTGSQLAIDLSVIGPSIDLIARWDSPFDDNCTGGKVDDATIRASAVSFKATGTLSLSQTGPPLVGLVLSNLDVQVTGATATGPFGVPEIVELLADVANSFIGGALANFLRPVVADVILGLIPSIGTPLTEDLTLNSASLRFSGGMRSILLSGSPPTGFVRLGAFARLDALTIDPLARASRGAVRSLCGTTLLPCPGGAPSVPPFSSAHAVSLAMHQDVLNHTFWSAWRAGAFNVGDAKALPGVGTLAALSMSTRATLPPISMAMGDEPSTFEMAWGDLRVSAAYDPATIGAPAGEPIVVESWVSVVVRGALGVDAAAQRFALADELIDVNVQVIDATLPFSDAPLRAAIASDVRSAIASLARRTLGIVPVDLSADGLGHVAATEVVRSNSWYLLGGSIQ